MLFSVFILSRRVCLNVILLNTACKLDLHAAAGFEVKGMGSFKQRYIIVTSALQHWAAPLLRTHFDNFSFEVALLFLPGWRGMDYKKSKASFIYLGFIQTNSARTSNVGHIRGDTVEVGQQRESKGIVFPLMVHIVIAASDVT